MSIKEAKFDYQRRDGQVSVLITWHAQTKLKSSASLKAYDVHNKLLSTSQPTKINLSKGQIGYSSWNLGISELSPGFYHVDLVLDTAPIWRTFFRITD